MTFDQYTPNASQSKQPNSSDLPDSFAFALSRRWKVIPCLPKYIEKDDKWKKEPQILDWPNKGTINTGIIEGWISEFGPSCIPGVLMFDNGLFVVDPDKRKGGVETLGRMIAERGPFPETLTTQTPGDGFHYYFNDPGNPLRPLVGGEEKLGPGLDVIAGRGQVIAPYSVIEGYGAYRLINDAPVANAPDWLIDLITNARAAEAPSNTAVMGMLGKLQTLHTWKDPNLLLAAAHAAAAWPSSISHDPSMIIGSFLASVAKWEPDKIVEYVVLIAQAVGKTGESLADVRRTARGGWERMQKGEKNIAGFPKLRTLLGEEAATQFAQLLGCRRGGGKGKEEEEHDWQFNVTTASAVSPQPVSWIWPGRLIRKKLVLCSGDTEVGKSLLICDIVARISKGRSAPLDDDWLMPKGRVLWFVTEDDIEETLNPRLQAAGADLDMVHIVDTLIDETGKRRGFDITKDLQLLEELLRSFPDAVLVVFDPLQEYIGLKLDSHNNAAIRGALGPFIEIAKRFNVGYLGVSHVSKQRQGSVRTSSIGSVAFSAISRAAWFIDDETDVDEQGRLLHTGRKLMAVAKSNLAKPEDKKTYAFTIETRAIPVTINSGTEWEMVTEIETAAVVWQEGVDASAESVWTSGEKKKPGPQPQKLEEAVNWLRTVLFSHTDMMSGHPVYRDRRSKEIDALREGEGISKSSFERAKTALGVRSVSRDGEYWLWAAELNSKNVPPAM